MNIISKIKHIKTLNLVIKGYLDITNFTAD